MSWLLLLAPHILYINFDGATIHGGTDCSDAPTNCSSLAGSSGVVGYPPFSGSAATQQQILTDVAQMYARFNVQLVTSRPPPTTPYSMTMVGGSGSVIGVPANWVGVAPIDCSNQNENDISFVFAAQLSNPHDIAVTIAQESGHGFGLAHTNDQGDVMYPYVSSAATGFLDKDMRVYDLGGTFNSDCLGTGHQNSLRQLMFNVGHAGGPDTTPPTVAYQSPHDGDTVASGFTIVLDANDDVLVASVDVQIDGAPLGRTLTLPPFQLNVASGSLPAGPHHITASARDLDGNMASAPDITVSVKKLGDSPGDLGSSCRLDGDCNGGGFCAGGACTYDCKLAQASSCPSGFHCGTIPGRNVCQRNEEGGCTAMPHASSSQPIALLVLLLVSMAGSRSLAAARAARRR